jgi:hypothetical protein
MFALTHQISTTINFEERAIYRGIRKEVSWRYDVPLVLNPGSISLIAKDR